MNSRTLVTVDDELEQRIRDDADEWLIVSRGSSSDVHLHIPIDDDEPLCERTVAKRDPAAIVDVKHEPWKRKPVAVYPPGYKPICQYCATKWVEERL